MEKVFELKIFHPRIKSGEWDIGYKTPGAAALDVVAAIDDWMILWPGERAKIPLGFAVWIKDPNVAALLLPRSGLGGKGFVMSNLVGLIDSDYQGQMALLAWNTNTEDQWVVQPGDRIGQIMFVPVIRPAFSIVDEFSAESVRGEGGYGSTGLR